MVVPGFDAEFVVSASQVLDECVPSDHDRCDSIGSQTAHRPKSCLESSVIVLDPTIRILLGVMNRVGKQLVHNSKQGCSQIGGHLRRSAVGCKHISEELSGGADVASFGHVYVDDLAVLIDRSVHVAAHTCDLDISFVHKPTVAHRVTAWTSGVDQQWCEALYPSVDGDVINLDATLCEEFFDITVGQAVAEVPADSQQDHLRRKPIPGKRSGLNTAAAIHQNMLAAQHPIRQRNSAPKIGSANSVTCVSSSVNSSGVDRSCCLRRQAAHLGWAMLA